MSRLEVIFSYLWVTVIGPDSAIGFLRQGKLLKSSFLFLSYFQIYPQFLPSQRKSARVAQKFPIGRTPVGVTVSTASGLSPIMTDYCRRWVARGKATTWTTGDCYELRNFIARSLVD